MTKGKARVRKALPWAVTLIGVMGLIAVVPTPTLGQTHPNASPSQQSSQGKHQPTTVNDRLDSNSRTQKDDKSYYNVHTFEGKAGEQITIDLTSSEFDSYLILLDPESKKIAEDDDGGSRNNARIIVTLPTSGTYTIIANARRGGETGNYTLSWRKTTSDDLALAEALKLNQQVVQLRDQGQYAAAIPLAERALAIREKVLGQEHPDVATSLNNLALLYSEMGNYSQAEPLYQRSLAIREKVFGQEHPDVAISLNTLALLYQAQGNYSQAELLFQRSLAIREVDNKQSDQYRQQVGTLKAQADELEAILSRRSAQFRKASQPVTLEAVQQLIPADAALVELVLYQPFNPKATKPDETWGTPRYVAYVLHSQGEAKWVDLGEAAPINQSVEDFRKALQSDASDVQPVARALDAKLMQPIRKLLGNTRNVLLSPDSQLNLIPFAALVDENNRYLVENYSINYLSSGRDLLRLQNHAQSRSAPVVMANPDYDKPGDPTSVQLVARGGSNQNANARTVPLSTKSAQTRNSNNRGLIDVLQQSFAPLPNTAQEADAIAQLLSGVTVLTGSQATENAIKQLHGSMILHIATHGFFHLGEDVQEVAPPDFSVTTFLQNTRSAKLTVRPSENPLLRSGIALAGANPRKSGDEDGILTALEAAGLDLSGTKLVVLSACETGLGEATNGQGVYGLRRAFAIAGAESQLISLWAVNTYATKTLMVNYYQRLKNNVGRSEALRQTQLEMLRSQNYQHPYYWAAFIPSGDWTAMGQ
jgi:CHAT domain-containing protein